MPGFWDLWLPLHHFFHCWGLLGWSWIRSKSIPRFPIWYSKDPQGACQAAWYLWLWYRVYLSGMAKVQWCPGMSAGCDIKVYEECWPQLNLSMLAFALVFGMWHLFILSVVISILVFEGYPGRKNQKQNKSNWSNLTNKITISFYCQLVMILILSPSSWLQ